MIDVRYDREAIKGAIGRHLKNGRYGRNEVYDDGRVNERIAEVLAKVPLRIEKRLAY